MSSVTDLNETTSGSSSGQPQLLRVLSARTGTALIVGGIIGSGIFMVPSSVASQVGSPSLSRLDRCRTSIAGGGILLRGAGRCDTRKRGDVCVSSESLPV